jgi:DNA-binding response OmpR family regulator
MSTTTDATILLAEEDECTRTFLYENLSADGYRVLAAADRAKALALLSTQQPDLVVVDVNGQTLALLDAVRSGEGVAGLADPRTPLIVLSRDADELQRIRMLERGSDDVVGKPFAYPELRARIESVLRRSRTSPGARVVRVGCVTIDVVGRQVSVAGTPVRLTTKEYELLLALASEPERVFTREELVRGVWGYRSPTRTLDSHASRLRRKLLDAGARGLVINVWGVGYRLIDGFASRSAEQVVEAGSR